MGQKSSEELWEQKQGRRRCVLIEYPEKRMQFWVISSLEAFRADLLLGYYLSEPWQ